MNQNFSFKKEFVPKILAKQKFITNRAYSEFRAKCKKGDIMYLFTGMRTKNCEKIGDAIVKEVAYWRISEILLYKAEAKTKLSPLRDMTWDLFAFVDGFDDYYEFVDFFSSDKIYRNGILSYRFELITEVK